MCQGTVTCAPGRLSPADPSPTRGTGKRQGAEESLGLKVSGIGHLNDLLSLFGVSSDQPRPRGSTGPRDSRPLTLSGAVPDREI